MLVRATSRTTSTSREAASAHHARWPMQGCASHLPDTLSRAFALYAYGYACAPDRLKIGLTEGDTVDRIAAQLVLARRTSRSFRLKSARTIVAR